MKKEKSNKDEKEEINTLLNKLIDAFAEVSDSGKLLALRVKIRDNLDKIIDYVANYDELNEKDIKKYVSLFQDVNNDLEEFIEYYEI